MTKPAKGSWFSIGHLSITLGLVAWAFTRYEMLQERETRLEALLSEQRAEIAQLDKRLDIQRNDIRALQAQINTHISNYHGNYGSGGR